MIAPVHRLKKQEILWLGRHRCRHGHTFLEHYPCFLNENPLGEKIGFFDIESSSLNAVYGYIFSFCIKLHREKMFKRAVTQKEIRTYQFDKPLVKELIDTLKTLDRVVVYWGKDRRHDLPFIRSRAVFYGMHFPEHGELKITDLYDIVKGKFRLHNNRLGTICDFLDIESKTHPITPKIWCYAGAGHTKSLRYILKHNEEDVISLEKLYERIINFGAKRNISI